MTLTGKYDLDAKSLTCPCSVCTASGGSSDEDRLRILTPPNSLRLQTFSFQFSRELLSVAIEMP